MIKIEAFNGKMQFNISSDGNEVFFTIKYAIDNHYEVS